MRPKHPLKGWRAGRGNRENGSTPDNNVELLLGSPRKDRKNSGLTAIHMYFRFNPRSGMVLLVAASDKVPVYYNQDGEWKELKHPATRVLYQRTTRLKLAAFEYDFTFLISPSS